MIDEEEKCFERDGTTTRRKKSIVSDQAQYCYGDNVTSYTLIRIVWVPVARVMSLSKVLVGC